MFLNNQNNSDPVRQSLEEPNKIIALNSNNFNDDDEIDLSEITRIIRRRGLAILVTTIALGGALSSWVLLKPSVYEAKFQLLVEPLNKKNQSLEALTQIVPESVTLGDSGLDYESQIDVLKSPLVMNPIIEKIKSRYSDLDIEDFMGNLKLQQSGKTKIIDVAYRDLSEEKILFVLKQVMQGYLDYQAEELITSLRQAQVFVDKQIDRVQQDVSLLESQLVNFQQNNNLIDPSTQNTVLAEQNKFLLQEVESVQNELKAKTQLAQDLRNQLDLTPEQGVIVSRLNQEKNYAKLIAQIKEIESKIALETIKLGAQHPTLTTLTAQKEKLIALLNQETQQILGYRSANLSLNFLTSISNNVEMIQEFLKVNNEVEALRAKEQGLRESQAKFNQQINRLSTTNKEYVQIQRELKTNNESLSRLLALKENLQIEVAKQTAPWKLLTPIDEELIEDVSGRTKKIALITIASLFMGVVVGFLLDKLDSTFHSVEELQSTIELPILGIIPYNKQLDIVMKKKTAKQKKSPVVNFNFGKPQKENNDDNIINLDAYFSLYTNINLLGSDTAIRSIVIAAAEASEGKSSTSVSLGKAVAMLGKKVLIVDVDMRKPKSHVYLGLKNKVGLSNFIADDIPLEEVIQSSDLDNLYFISAGVKAPNPTRSISSHKMQTLMKTLREQFDFIIYDTPPLMGFSDAKILTPFTDGLVYVIGLGKTYRQNVQRVLYDLQLSRLSILGMIANGLKNYVKGDYGYGYYDYSRYYQD